MRHTLLLVNAYDSLNEKILYEFLWVIIYPNTRYRNYFLTVLPISSDWLYLRTWLTFTQNYYYSGGFLSESKVIGILLLLVNTGVSIVSGYLMYLLFFVIHKVCLVCLAVNSINFILWIYSIYHLTVRKVKNKRDWINYSASFPAETWDS